MKRQKIIIDLTIEFENNTKNNLHKNSLMMPSTTNQTLLLIARLQQCFFFFFFGEINKRLVRVPQIRVVLSKHDVQITICWFLGWQEERKNKKKK